jgi:hypothetical protein
MRRTRAVAPVILLLFLAWSTPAAALEIHGAGLRSSAAAVQAVFELRDLVAGSFEDLIERGGVLHLRVQAEVWERRAAWDLLVYPAVVRVVRISKAAGSPALLLVDDRGTSTTHDRSKQAIPLEISIGDAGRIRTSGRYYARVMATLGTIAEREADNYSDAVFGRPGETNGLGSLGREVFRRILQLTDYLQSESAEARSRAIAGAHLITR